MSLQDSCKWVSIVILTISTNNDGNEETNENIKEEKDVTNNNYFCTQKKTSPGTTFIR